MPRALRIGRLIFSDATFAEFEEVAIRSKFDKYVSLGSRDEFRAAILDASVFIEVDTQIKLCRDPKDDKFLSLAQAAQARFLITGDADLLALDPYGKTRILMPRDFLDLPA